MLELKNIRKIYKVGDIETKALDGISVAFREKEFVAILGPSGSGKTTCLNIIGGLDRYTGGDLIIKGKKTSNFSDRDWDAYRNNSIGFVFQSYNLITHLSIVANVELGMTLSGISKEEKHRRALDVLNRVGLGDHLHKKPNQLSGGQMQRVAIARALANDPEILLCDEPTGALDSDTSVQIMELIKELAADRLVIMVTHNPDLANRYADRIIQFEDGKIISDSRPHDERPKEDMFNLRKTHMSFLTALSLSFGNLRTKKGRTFLTSFASSIGIIGIALILSLSSGFQAQIDKYQSDALSEFPIIINKSSIEMDEETMAEYRQQMQDTILGTAEYQDSDEVILYDPSENKLIHKNTFSDEYLEYVNNIGEDICSSVGYLNIINMNILRNDGKAETVKFKVGAVSANASDSGTESGSGASNMSAMSGMNSAGMYSYPTPLSKDDRNYIEKNYDLLAGDYPKSETDLVLTVDSKNRIDYTVLKDLGFDTENVESIKFDDIVGTEFKIITNDDFYDKTEFGTFVPGSDYESMYNSENSITIRICGIVRLKSSVSITMLANGVIYNDALISRVINSSLNSEIVKAQKESDTNVFTMEPVDEDKKEQIISYLGGSTVPASIFIYPRDFDSKEAVIEYLDAYNEGKSEEEIVTYTDLADSISSLTKNIMDAITIVLIAFAAISLVVSLIMICIITYTSVLERTKEIGILRALGARKKDISRVFDAETFILGIFSGVLGVLIAGLLTIPTNIIIENMSGLAGVAHLQPIHTLILVILSTLLTMLGGHIPARIAAKRDAVVALRSGE